MDYLKHTFISRVISDGSEASIDYIKKELSSDPPERAKLLDLLIDEVENNPTLEGAVRHELIEKLTGLKAFSAPPVGAVPVEQLYSLMENLKDQMVDLQRNLAELKKSPELIEQGLSPEVKQEIAQLGSQLSHLKGRLDDIK